MTFRTIIGVCLALVSVTACVSATRPQTPVAVDTLHYSEAVADARQKQMLLNIVRLRYNDPIGFLEVTSLSTSDNTEYSGGLGSSIGLDDGPFDEVLAGSGKYGRSHTPKLVYDNLRGDAYAKQLLQPLPASSIFLLSQSGWSVERLMLCCISRFGKLDNARSAAGPTPSAVPDNSDFRTLAAHLRRLQLGGNMLVQVLGTGDDQSVVLKWRAEPELDRIFAQLDAGKPKALSNGSHLAVISARGDANGDYAVRGRSLLGILSALSQSVIVPEAHRTYVGHTGQGQGPFKTASPCEAGSVWDDINGGFFAVQSSRSKPRTARLSVPYRGYWFYIDDSCRSAKSTLDLVGHLYALQAGISGAGEGGSLLLLGQ